MTLTLNDLARPLCIAKAELLYTSTIFGGGKVSQPWRGSGSNWNFYVTFAYLILIYTHRVNNTLLILFSLMLFVLMYADAEVTDG